MPDLSYFNQSIPLANGLALTTITTYLLSLVVPFVERLPFAHNGAPLHDPIIRLLNFLVNGAFTLVLAASTDKLSLSHWTAYLVAAFGQSVGSHLLYTGIKSSAASNGGTPQKPAASSSSGTPGKPPAW